MAGRAAAKLRKDLDFQLTVEPEEKESSDEEEESKPFFNPFSLIDDVEQDEQEDPDSEQEPEPNEPQLATGAPPATGGRANVAAGSSSSKRSKSKKKGKGKVAAADSAEVQGAESSKPEEDIDQILQELNIQPSASPAAQRQAAGTGDNKPLLAIDTRNLRADDELRRMFGRLVHDDADEGDVGGGLAGASRRVRRLAARGLLRRQPLKPGLIIQPKDHWPRFDGGYSMELRAPNEEGKPVYTFVRSQTYQAVQELYEECQATFDPNAVAALLQAHPYHLDALLTMHDLYRNMGEQSYADEMLERCVYALEMSMHPSFWGAAGAAHVPYEEDNLALFVALFRYMQALSRRGLHRTALEICKLLLGLNSDDPLGALCCIDYLALRAGQYAWLRRFAHAHGGGLPNLVYSLALLRWYEEREPTSGRGLGRASAASVGDPAAGDQPSSLDLLTTAVQMHPLVVVRMQAKLRDKGVGHEAEWAELLAQPLFAPKGGGAESASLSHLVDIFVERQHLLWKAPEVQAWLRQACAAAPGPGVADWACMREQTFPASEVNEYRHLRVAEFSDAINRLPPEEMHGMQEAAMPREVDMAAMEEMVAQAQGDMADDELQAANPLAMLLRTLLPWVNVGQEPPAEDQAGAPQQQQQQRRDDDGGNE